MSSKPRTKFKLKDKTKKEHHHDLTHSVKCPIKIDLSNGETGRRLIEWVNEHSEKNINSHMFKYLIEANHLAVTLDNFTVVNTAYRNRKFNMNVSESLITKPIRLTLNKHDTLVPLKLFNYCNRTMIPETFMQNPVESGWWKFCQKKLADFTRWLFSEKAPSWMFCCFLNTPHRSRLMSFY